MNICFPATRFTRKIKFSAARWTVVLCVYDDQQTVWAGVVDSSSGLTIVNRTGRKTTFTLLGLGGLHHWALAQ